MSGWEAYIYQLQNKYDTATNQYLITNVNEHAAIYGLDGTCWAKTAAFNLSSYKFDLEDEEGKKKSVDVNEFVTALEASKGNRKGSEAGIRMNNEKYMLIQHNADADTAYLGKAGGGGACIARTNTAVIITVWNKKLEMSNKQLQNPGLCNEVTEKMQAFLKGQNF